MKNRLFICVLILFLILFVGCNRSDIIKSTQAPETTTAVTTETTEESTTASTTAQTTHVPSTARSTVYSTSRSAASTQRKRQQEHKTTVSTTQKTMTTTKKSTTTAPYWCTDGGSHHVIDVGTIGWCTSYSEAEQKALKYIGDNNTSGRYEVQEYSCGLFTAYVTLN